MRHTPLVLVLLLDLLAMAVLCACQGGGCPDTNPSVTNIKLTPSTPCLTVTASDSGSCGQIDHALSIKNACSVALVIGGETIKAGSSASLAINTSDSKVCVGASAKSSCSLTGTLGVTMVTISWDVE